MKELFALFYLNPLMVKSFYALTSSMFALPLVTIDNLISSRRLNTIHP